MKRFNAKTRYALLAAMDLAAHYDGEKPVKIHDIAFRTGIPPKYLVHILLDLKRRALASSVRGAAGGYWLMRSPEMISVAEVIEAVLARSSRRAAAADEETPYGAAVEQLYREMQRNERAFISQVSLAELLRVAQGG